MRTEQSVRVSCENEKPADEGATHVSDISNIDHTDTAQDAAEDGPGVHERVSNTCFYIR